MDESEAGTVTQAMAGDLLPANADVARRADAVAALQSGCFYGAPPSYAVFCNSSDVIADVSG